MNSTIAHILKTADDRSFAVELANILRTEINLLPIKIDWTWDVEGFEFNLGKTLFTGKPVDFINFDINGGLLFRITWNPDIRSERPTPGTPKYQAWDAGGGTHVLQNRVFKINVGVSIYPGHSSVHSFGYTDLGSFKVVSTAHEKISFIPGQSFSQIKVELKDLISRMVENPPTIMRTPEWEERIQQTKEKEADRQVVEQQRKQRQEITEGEKEFYGSLDLFENFVIEENDGIFGNPDLQKLMKHTGKGRREIMEDLKGRGLTFSPELKQSLATSWIFSAPTFGMKPLQIVHKLYQIATAIENSKRPDRNLVARDLQLLIAALNQTDEKLCIDINNAVRNFVNTKVNTKIDWDWDAREADPQGAYGKMGRGVGKISFPGKPEGWKSVQIPNGGTAALIGGLVWHATWDPSIHSQLGNTGALAGATLKVKVEIATMWKAQGGQQAVISGYTHLDDLVMVFDANGVPDVIPQQSPATFKQRLDGLIGNIAKQPPVEMQSAAYRKEKAKQQTTEKQVQEQKQKQQGEFEADRDTHGSIEAFVDHIMNQTEDTDTPYTFGLPDFNKLLSYLYNNQAERTQHRSEVMQELKSYGLTFSPTFNKYAFVDVEFKDIIMKLASAGLTQQARDFRTLLAMMP